MYTRNILRFFRETVGGSEKNRLVIADVQNGVKMTYTLQSCSRPVNVDDVLRDARPSVNEALLQVAAVTPHWCLVHTLDCISPKIRYSTGFRSGLFGLC